MHQTAIRLALIGLCGWLPPAMKPAPVNPVSAPLVYEETMLVLVSKDGVAAVVFRATGDGTASYDYRFESKDGTETETGTRPLSERKDAAGRYVGEQFIKAGPIVVEWSQGDPKRG